MLALQDLWGNVVWCATDGALLLTIMLELRRQAEISHLHLAFSIQEQIPQLEIAVDYSAPVQVLQGNYQLVQVEHGLWLGQPLAWTLSHQLIQCLIRAHFENDVDILAILKVIIKVHYLVVIQRPVDRDFRSELCMRPWFLDRRFCNDLCGENFFGLHVLHLVALSEAALAKKATFLVSSR
jgi:hypothetical protein